MINASLFSTPITLLISYDEVLRDPNMYILKFLLTNKRVRSQLEEYIDLSRFKSQSDDHIHAVLSIRKTKNILEWLSRKPFKYEKNYNALYENNLRMFEESPALEMYRALTSIIDQAFVKKVYVYNKFDDKRQRYDLYKTFGKNDKLVYVNGNYLDVVERIGEINVFIDNDVDRISPIFSYPSYANSLFMIAKYGYNYEENKILENSYELKGGLSRFAAKHKLNIVEFSPVKITPEMIRNG